MSFINIERCFINVSLSESSSDETIELVKYAGDIFTVNIMRMVKADIDCSVHFIEGEKELEKLGYNKKKIRAEWVQIYYPKYYMFQYYIGSKVRDYLDNLRNQIPYGNVYSFTNNNRLTFITPSFMIEGPDEYYINFRQPTFINEHLLIKIKDGYHGSKAILNIATNVKDDFIYPWCTFTEFLTEEYEGRQRLKDAIDKLDIKKIMDNLGRNPH